MCGRLDGKKFRQKDTSKSIPVQVRMYSLIYGANSSVRLHFFRLPYSSLIKFGFRDVDTIGETASVHYRNYYAAAINSYIRMLIRFLWFSPNMGVLFVGIAYIN